MRVTLVDSLAHDPPIFEVENCKDLQISFDNFYTEALRLLNAYFPVKKVTITSGDSSSFRYSRNKRFVA